MPACGNAVIEYVMSYCFSALRAFFPANSINARATFAETDEGKFVMGHIVFLIAADNGTIFVPAAGAGKRLRRVKASSAT